MKNADLLSSISAEAVGVRQNYKGANADLRGHISAEAAEDQTKISQQQVSRWRKVASSHHGPRQIMGISVGKLSLGGR
jgi:hypothetical protein